MWQIFHIVQLLVTLLSYFRMLSLTNQLQYWPKFLTLTATIVLDSISTSPNIHQIPFVCAGVVLEFSTKVLTVLFPPSLKGVFYHSVIVLLLSVIIGRCVLSDNDQDVDIRTWHGGGSGNQPCNKAISSVM